MQVNSYQYSIKCATLSYLASLNLYLSSVHITSSPLLFCPVVPSLDSIYLSPSLTVNPVLSFRIVSDPLFPFSVSFCPPQWSPFLSSPLISFLNFRCYAGFSGVNCSLALCLSVNNCSGHGQCLEADLCNCDVGYTGPDCANVSCEGVNYCSGEEKVLS